jgi:uncharacterized protein YegL
MSEPVAAYQRRLPVYILLDCSGSMAGEPIVAIETGLRTLLADLTNDPQAMDTVWLSVISFDSSAEQLVPLTDITEFRAPDLEASGSTALGEAMELLAEQMREEVRTTTESQKGDWKPLIFVFTDGEPNEGWEEAVDDFRSQGLATIIACGAGTEVHEETLRRLGDKVILLKDTQPGTLGAFMQWVTASVTAACKSLGTRAKSGEELAEVPEDQGIRIIQ